jgi:hypothetical protein
MTEDGKAKGILQGIAGGANDLRRAYEEAGTEEERPYTDITEFARQSRKDLEPLLFTYKQPVAQEQDRHIVESEAMKLLTKEIRDKLPPLYSQEKVQDPMVQVKFFTPDSNWTWYGIEFDGKDLFFGWVVGFEKEMGYFSLKELESARGPLGLAIERDKWFTPMRLSEVKKLHQSKEAEMGQGVMATITLPKAVWKDISGALDKLLDMEARQKKRIISKQEFANLEHFMQAIEGKEGAVALTKRDWRGISTAVDKLLEFEAGLTKREITPRQYGLLERHLVDIEAALKEEAEMAEGIKKYTPCWEIREALKKTPEGAEKLLQHAKWLNELADWAKDCPTLQRAAYELSAQIKLGVEPLLIPVKASQGGPKTIQQLLSEQALLEQHQKDRPQDIIFFKDTIMKHYYPKEDFYPDSFRVVKPEPGVMVTLGCLKKDKWYPEKLECVPTQTLHRTIVPRVEKYIKEAEEWEAVGVPTQHRETEVGIVPRELVEVV